MISLGGYSEVFLAQARSVRDNYRALLVKNIELLIYRNDEEQAKEDQLNNTFEAVAWQRFKHQNSQEFF